MNVFAWLCTDGSCGSETLFVMIFAILAPFIGAALIMILMIWGIARLLLGSKSHSRKSRNIAIILFALGLLLMFLFAPTRY